jgi:crossover junction endodeoxyribonuclease RuvC
MIVAGIDPGMTGAMVLLFPDNSVIVKRVPLINKAGKTTPAWTQWFVDWAMGVTEANKIVIELVGSRPGQGAPAGFNFGRSFGFVHAIACQGVAPIHFVTPAVWKAKSGLLKADKNASREEARRLLPKIANEVSRVKDDGVAEAALLALYGRKYL